MTNTLQFGPCPIEKKRGIHSATVSVTDLLPSARLDLSTRGDKEDIEIVIVNEEELVVDGVEEK